MTSIIGLYTASCDAPSVHDYELCEADGEVGTL